AAAPAGGPMPAPRPGHRRATLAPASVRAPPRRILTLPPAAGESPVGPRGYHRNVDADPLQRFSRLASTWFRDAFAEPTVAQSAAWDAISQGQDTLVVAPTGSGKTLAAFLWALDRLAGEPPPHPAPRPRGAVVP